jgi:dTMP kinase
MTTRAPGRFITLEGGEGAGKSTQAQLLKSRLETVYGEVVLTREPGGSQGAEEIRSLLVRGEAGRWSATTEALLMYAARSDHLERTIRPALARGAVVICDRFADSSEAYQGAGGGVPQETLSALRSAVVGSTEPDLTLIFDLPVEDGLRRAAGRGGDERFESMGIAFHQRMRARFLEIAACEPRRCAVIDALQTPDAIAAQVAALVAARLDV